MAVEALALRQFRNLTRADLSLSPRLNIVYGDNAAGKTSLLEALHVLARARSFQRVGLRRLTRTGAAGFVVRGEIEAGGIQRLAVGHQEGRLRVRLNGCEVRTLSHIAGLLPVQVINTQSQELLTVGPSERRAFLNWGVFHVEPSYATAWRRYQRALEQRNSALRAGDARVVDAQAAGFRSAAEVVDSRRCEFLGLLEGPWRRRVREWFPNERIRWEYRRGWPNGEPLDAMLARTAERELRLGYSLAGPHRADLRITADGEDAARRLSRGQQKLLVIALRLALIEVVVASGTATPLVLIDDLPAELDSRHRDLVLRSVVDQGAQIVVTAIDAAQVPPLEVATSVFHVEQGICRAMV